MENKDERERDEIERGEGEQRAENREEVDGGKEKKETEIEGQNIKSLLKNSPPFADRFMIKTKTNFHSRLLALRTHCHIFHSL